ncbi:hypothetical protein [Cohnella cholangitidis]|uniref:HPP family protein n=1 Tax=Cohnella cholangitidis TaxID=2598458 RepID=A0A7G5BYB9_9BACL|nr:hypothetical protein [Cohnella cholangitidis]QMV41953.1 hypothetical protein FPL14_12700 [Cohnella cholangitidis]
MMNLKTIAICLYIVVVYWISTHIPSLHSLFFPTIGAFSLLFISKPFSKTELSKIAFGAIVSSVIGTVIVSVHPGVISLFINTIIVITLITKLKWNAPPILAVSFVPFFVQPTFIWAIPLSVCGALLGLLITLYVVHQIESRWSSLPFLVKGTAAQVESEKAA